jgi:hypothetical protein
MNKGHDKKPQELTLEIVCQMAKETALRDGYHLPTLIADGHSQTVIVQITDMLSTHEARTGQMFMVGYRVANEGLVGILKQVFFISEDWMSTVRAAEDLRQMPSQDPKRKEVLMISGLKLNETEGRVRMYEMIRDSVGTLTDLRAFPDEGETPGVVASPLLDAYLLGHVAGLMGPIN